MPKLTAVTGADGAITRRDDLLSAGPDQANAGVLGRPQVESGAPCADWHSLLESLSSARWPASPRRRPSTPSSPERFYNTFSGAHPPALRIKPGDRVITRTIDAGGADWNGKPVTPGPNPQTGPFFVEGAEPGDMLVVTFDKIEINRTTAYSSGALAPYTVTPDVAAVAHRTPGAARQLDPRQGERHRASRQRRHRRHRAAAAADARLRRRGAGAQGGHRHQHARRLRRQHGLRRARSRA